MTHFPRRLAVFDFDWSLIDNDSDHWTINTLSEAQWERCRRLQAEGAQWTDLMAQMLKELHEQGVTREQVEDVLTKIPFHPSMLEAIKLMKASNTELIILSDANTVYIETILKAYGVSDIFTAAITNPGHFDDAGRLHIRRHVGPDHPHGCTVGCSLNICKGQDLTQYLSTQDAFEQIIYIGDGRNDFCPATRLSSTDILLPRLNRALADLLQTDLSISGQIKAEVLYWQDGDDVLKIVRERIAGR